MPLILFVPETCRNVVGDGSIKPQTWNRTLFDIIHEYRISKRDKSQDIYAAAVEDVADELASGLALAQPKLRFPNPIASLRVVLEKDVFCIMAFAAVQVTGVYMIMIPLDNVFAKHYNYNELQVGLCYIPLALGSAIGSLLAGRFLDWNFKRISHKLGIEIDCKRAARLRKFPIEWARLQAVFIPAALGCILCISWGWLLDAKTNLAIPLVVLFLVGFCLNGSGSMMNCLLVDLYPQSPATVIAGYNVVRSLLSAGGTAAVQEMINGVGLGWTYTIVGLVLGFFFPLLVVAIKFGPRWREERCVRSEKAKEARELKRRAKQERLACVENEKIR